MRTTGGKAYDCVVVGGGPAGLTAALYLTRLRRIVCVIDSGESRTRLIPRIRNLPGWPDGIPGSDLLERLRLQLQRYEVEFANGVATGLEQSDAGFEVQAGTVMRARSVILATGIVDVQPEIRDHDEAVRQGLLRYCPVCDAYEVRDKRVGLLVTARQARNKAAYLRRFASSLDVRVVDPSSTITLVRKGNGVGLVENDSYWDTAYAMLGARPRSELARKAGFRVATSGYVLTDRQQRSGIAGAYAIGDVVQGLDQVSVAMGQAALAATHISNTLL